MTERTIYVKDIVGLAEIGDRIGVGKTTVHNWTVRHPDFPKPITRTGERTNLYDMSEVLRWKEGHPDVGVPGFKKGNNANTFRRDRQQPAEAAGIVQTVPRPKPPAPSKTYRSRRGLWDDEKPFPAPPTRSQIGDS